MFNVHMIPKIIHQLWIGPKTAPTELMDTWRDKHPEFEYIRWSEAEMKKRNFPLSCSNRINEMEEIAGKADIIRWEILYHYGGIFLDADSICIEPFDHQLTNLKAFVAWENEQCRSGLAAVGTMAFPPKHPLVRKCIEWIQQNCCSFQITKKRAWMLTGPVLLSNMLKTKLYPDISILPSYLFLPQHWTGLQYKGHAKVYAHQEWGSTNNSYESMIHAKLPPLYLPPTEHVSILISSYNTKMDHLQACLESIKHQNGHFNMEVVWINDGSDTLQTNLLKRALEHFENTTRFTEVVYRENESNKGLGYSLNKGIQLCSHSWIFRMDADDIMHPDRIQKQMEFVQKTPDCVLCGTQVQCFNDQNQLLQKTKHPHIITVEEFKDKPSHWFLNHPTVCFQKEAVLEAGNYNNEIHSMMEDFDLWLRILKKYGKIYNLPDILVNYRIHENQLTHNGGEKGAPFWHQKRVEKIKQYFS